jgi:hypothetical protein
MKTLQRFFGMSAAVALLGASVAMAEIRNDSIRGVPFSVSTADGTITLPDFTFDKIDGSGGEEAQATCAMTPGGTMSGLMTELPILQPVTPTYRDTIPDTVFAPSGLPSQRPYNERPLSDRRNPPNPPTPPDDPPPQIIVVTPEPATLVVVGLGLAGAAITRCRRRK